MSCFFAHARYSVCLVLIVITLTTLYWVKVVKFDGIFCTSNLLCYEVNKYGPDQMDISVRLNDILKLRDLVRNECSSRNIRICVVLLSCYLASEPRLFGRK
jgi:hypothetical protein